MADHRSSIDDLLITGVDRPVRIQAPETQPSPELVQEALEEIAPRETSDEYGLDAPEEPIQAAHSEPEQPTENVVDEYGNDAKQKTYTEEQVNERINQAVRDRLARLERNQNQPSQQQVQQATQSGFEYNPDSAESWQGQLENFVKQTVVKMSTDQARQAQEQREHQSQMEFETKFHSGKAKFHDFNEVVGAQPITDAMVLASRSLSDPAAFFYAAAKRAPKELAEIANIPDQYGQMMALGRLEQKMKQTRQSTSAPKPASRIRGDVPIKQQQERREPTIEEMIQQDAARKLALRKSRQR